MNLFLKLRSKIRSLIYRLTFSPIKYWEDRAQKHGALSVLNLSLNQEEISSVKDFQLETIFPLLKKELLGNEETLLDFGCGPGRLSIELSNFTNCKVTGVDPIEYLLQLAPSDPNVSYKKINNNLIPSMNDSFDIIWICFVLGGIVNNKDLTKTIKELNRVIKNNGLLFLIENTTNKKNIISWKYFSKEKYISLFKNFNLMHLKDFHHGGELFSIFSGRYKEQAIPVSQ